jgi:hypothetical protein
VVTLSGTVANLRAEGASAELAGKADNVVRVEDNLLFRQRARRAIGRLFEVRGRGRTS